MANKAVILIGIFSLVILISDIKANKVMEQDVLLTYKQKEILDEFKRRMSPILAHDYMKQDIYLVRWLRARNFNLPQAVEMLKANLRWRKASHMEHLRLSDFADISLKYPVHVDTFDKNGAPIFTAANGQWDLREAHLSGKGRRLNLFLDKALDEAATKVREAQQAGKNVTRFHLLLNQEGFNLIQHGCSRCFLGIVGFLQSYENHFPFLMDKLIVINDPASIQAVGPIVRNAVSSGFQDHVKLFGTNKAEWIDYLLEFIDEDQLTEEYGGTRIRNAGN